MRRALCAIAICLAALASGCARPPDEAWLRFLGFRAADGTSDLAVLEGKLRDGTTDVADALFQNSSSLVGSGQGGIGILVHRARVEYRLAGFALPADDYVLTLYLPAEDGESTPTGRLTGLPLAPASLKMRLRESGAFDNSTDTPTVRLAVFVTFLARTDDGLDIDTSGGITVLLANE